SGPTLEYRTDQVQEVFGRLLHRPADALGLAAWVPFLQAGHTVEELAAAVASSPEYFQQSGGGADGFLHALYRDLLGREIDPFGQQTFAQALAEGAGREQVAAVVLASPEYRTDLVRAVYRRLLGREADDAGLATFVAALGQGLRDEG